MTNYIQNYGFTKTLINNNNKIFDNEIKWEGNYNGSKANILVDINDNGKKEIIQMELNNDDIKQLLGISSVELPLEERLTNDFLKPRPRIFRNKNNRNSIVLEGALTNKKTRKSIRNKKRNRKTRSKKFIL
jgi:hypothetical protein